MIDFEHVTKVYETQNDENVALEDINIHIDEGEFVFILGHSGAGKSTFLKLIQIEEKPTEGKIYINDQDLTTIKRRKVPYLRRQMGAVFQSIDLWSEEGVLPQPVKDLTYQQSNKRHRQQVAKDGSAAGQPWIQPGGNSGGDSSPQFHHRNGGDLHGHGV